MGLISNDGLDWGGDEPSTNKIWAAQKRSAPVKEIEENPGTSEIEFDLIELKPANLVQVMGGTTSKNGKKWNAPSKRIKLEGPVVIRSADGSETEAAKVSLLAYPRGKYDYSDVMKIHCKATFLLPDDSAASPYGFDFAPDEGRGSCRIASSSDECESADRNRGSGGSAGHRSLAALFKIPFTRKVVRLTMRRPCLGGQIRLARLYLQTGVTYERMLEFTKHEELAYMALHGRRVSKMVALTICRGAFSTWLFSGLLAWLLRWFVDDEYLLAANMQFLRLLGTEVFYEYYQIDLDGEPDETEAEPRKRRKKGS